MQKSYLLGTHLFGTALTFFMSIGAVEPYQGIFHNSDFGPETIFLSPTNRYHDISCTGTLKPITS